MQQELHSPKLNYNSFPVKKELHFLSLKSYIPAVQLVHQSASQMRQGQVHFRYKLFLHLHLHLLNPILLQDEGN